MSDPPVYTSDGDPPLVDMGAYEYQPESCPGDLDGDEDADLDDFSLFAECMAGPDVTTPPPGCDPATFDLADIDADNDVDLADFAEFQRIFAGWLSLKSPTLSEPRIGAG